MKKRSKAMRCDDTKPVLKLRAADESVAKLAHGLGHPARVAIVRLLHRRGTCVCGEIVDRLPLAQSTVSQHLKVLQQTGWIQGEVDGPCVCYCIEPAAAKKLDRLLTSLLG